MNAIKALLLWGLFSWHSLAFAVRHSHSSLASTLNPSRYLSKRIPVAPNRWWVCGQPGDAQGQVSYYSSDVQLAVTTGYQAWINDQAIQASNGYEYPQVFYDNNFWNIRQALAQTGGPSNDLAEFPLVQDGFVFGDDPGPDRVVFDTITGEFLGVMTHRGLPNNRFRPALEHGSAPPIEHLGVVLEDFLRARPPPWEFGLPNYGGNY